MKKGYLRLLVFEIFIFSILLFSALKFNILTGFKMTIFLGCVLLYFNNRFGFEESGHRYRSDLLLDTVIFVLAFFLIYYLSGLFFGFAKTDYLSLEGVLKFTLPIASYIVMREYARYMFLCKASLNRLCVAATVILFIAIDLSEKLYFANLTNNYNIFLFVALTVLPSITTGIVLSYVSVKTGYKTAIVYALPFEIYRYFLPIVPNPNEYLTSLIDILKPLIYGYIIYSFYKKKDRDYESISQSPKKSSSFGSVFALALSTFVLVYFISGYFNFWIVAIASGSMSPSIEKGDLVLIEKVRRDYSVIAQGDVLAYEKDGTLIVHRVVAIETDGQRYFFRTKGDANSEEDKLNVEEKMVIGKVRGKIPYLGWPALWLNDL